MFYAVETDKISCCSTQRITVITALTYPNIQRKFMRPLNVNVFWQRVDWCCESILPDGKHLNWDIKIDNFGNKFACHTELSQLPKD